MGPVHGTDVVELYYDASTDTIDLTCGADLESVDEIHFQPPYKIDE